MVVVHCSVRGIAVVEHGCNVIIARFLYVVCGAVLSEVVIFCIGVAMVMLATMS